MPKKTPLEQFIAESGGDRRAAYEARMRKGGNRKVTVWVPEVCAEEVRDLCSRLVHSADPGAFRPEIHVLADRVADTVEVGVGPDGRPKAAKDFSA